MTLRITFQKALIASSELPTPLPTDPAGEISEKKRDTLRSLGDLNVQLFALREALPLPGAEIPVELGKRKRAEGDKVMEEEYWMQSARASLAMTDACALLQISSYGTDGSADHARICCLS